MIKSIISVLFISIFSSQSFAMDDSDHSSIDDGLTSSKCSIKSSHSDSPMVDFTKRDTDFSKQYFEKKGTESLVEEEKKKHKKKNIVNVGGEDFVITDKTKYEKFNNPSNAFDRVVINPKAYRVINELKNKGIDSFDPDQTVPVNLSRAGKEIIYRRKDGEKKKEAIQQRDSLNTAKDLKIVKLKEKLKKSEEDKIYYQDQYDNLLLSVGENYNVEYPRYSTPDGRNKLKKDYIISVLMSDNSDEYSIKDLAKLLGK